MIRNRIQRVPLESGELGDRTEDKQWIVPEVSFPEAARFATEPEAPLKSTTLHPTRGLPHTTGMEIKCGANPEPEPSIEGTPVVSHESFLFWRAEPNPYDVWFSFG